MRRDEERAGQRGGDEGGVCSVHPRCVTLRVCFVAQGTIVLSQLAAAAPHAAEAAAGFASPVGWRVGGGSLGGAAGLRTMPMLKSYAARVVGSSSVMPASCILIYAARFSGPGFKSCGVVTHASRRQDMHARRATCAARGASYAPGAYSTTSSGMPAARSGGGQSCPRRGAAACALLRPARATAAGQDAARRRGAARTRRMSSVVASWLTPCDSSAHQHQPCRLEGTIFVSGRCLFPAPRGVHAPAPHSASSPEPPWRNRRGRRREWGMVTWRVGRPRHRPTRVLAAVPPARPEALRARTCVDKGRH